MKHKSLLFMAIGGVATALIFVPASAGSPALGIPGDEVCRAPVDPRSTSTTTNPPPSTTQPPVTTLPPTTTTELSTTLTEPPTTVEVATTTNEVTSDSTSEILGLRSVSGVGRVEEGLKFRYSIRLTALKGRGDILQNPCNWRNLLFGNPLGGALTKWELTIPQLKDSGCEADVFINGSKDALLGVGVERRDGGLVVKFDHDIGKAATFEVKVVFLCERPYAP